MIPNPKRIHRRATLEALTALVLVLLWSGAGRIGWIPGPVAALTTPLRMFSPASTSSSAAERDGNNRRIAEPNLDSAKTQDASTAEHSFHVRGGGAVSTADTPKHTPERLDSAEPKNDAVNVARVPPAWQYRPESSNAPFPTGVVPVPSQQDEPPSATPGSISKTGATVPVLDLTYDSEDLQRLITGDCAALFLETNEETYHFEPLPTQTWPAGRWTRLNPTLAKRLSNRFVRLALSPDASVQRLSKELVKTAPAAGGDVRAALVLRFYADFDAQLAAQQLAACRKAGLPSNPTDETRLAQTVIEARLSWAADPPQLVVQRVTLDGVVLAPATEGPVTKEKGRRGS